MMGITAHSTLTVEIVTYPFKWKVTRYYQDFQTLRIYLLKRFPQTIIPSLPHFNSKKKLTLKQQAKKNIYLTRFLTVLMKSQVIRSAPFLVDFLKETNKDEFTLKAMAT
jgi:hypothetical protein